MASFDFTSARRATLAAVAALALGIGTLATAAPAEAFGGHGGGFGGGFHGGGVFRPSVGGFGGLNRGGFNRGGLDGGGLGRAGIARGGFGRGNRIGAGFAGLGLGLAAGGLLGAYAGDGYAYNDGYGYGYGADDGCLRTVLTAGGYRTVNVCD